MNLAIQYLLYIRTKVVEFWNEKLNTFYRGSIILLGLLWLVRIIFPSVLDVVKNVDTDDVAQVGAEAPVEAVLPEEPETPVQPVVTEGAVYENPNTRTLNVGGKWHRVKGVATYENFNDMQEVQLMAAQKLGITPAKNREEAERQKQGLIYVGGSPYYHIDEAMSSSQPYLVPRANELLNRIGRNFFDSLYVKNLPLYKIIVSSVWRTESDVASLSRFNPNATKQSCHLYATTIDISYVRFQPLPAPKGHTTRTVGDDILKYVLSEVLRDLRDEGACYVKHERKMPCFHITVR